MVKLKGQLQIGKFYSIIIIKLELYKNAIQKQTEGYVGILYYVVLILVLNNTIFKRKINT